MASGSGPGTRRIGAHLPLGGGMVKAVDRAAEIGARTLQIFSDNPAAWRRRGEPPTELDAFRERLRSLDILPLAIHGPYLINLAGPDPDFWERSIATLVTELLVGARYGAAFVNIHIGSHRGSGTEAGATRLAAGVARALSGTPSGADGPKLVLENSAGSGDGLGASVEDLATILQALGRAGVDTRRVGFCLDTAHLWAAGYEIRRPEVLDAFLREFDARLGPDALVMLHLNDARAPLGSRLDRHEHVGAGAIGEEGFRAILRHPRLAALPAYLETPGMDVGYDAVNLERIRLLLAGEPLPELPPEAFTLPRSRSRTAPRSEEGAA